jgi:hypothetical protein
LPKSVIDSHAKAVKEKSDFPPRVSSGWLAFLLFAVVALVLLIASTGLT